MMIPSTVILDLLSKTIRLFSTARSAEPATAASKTMSSLELVKEKDKRKIVHLLNSERKFCLLSLTICSLLLKLKCLRLYPKYFFINIVPDVPCLELSDSTYLCSHYRIHH